MADNFLFLERPHKCVICKSDIDMQKVDRYVTECMRMQHSPPRRDDIVIVKDYGNEVDIVCCFECYLKYLHVD